MPDFMTEWWFFIVMLLLLLLMLVLGIGMVVFVMIQASKQLDREDYDVRGRP